MRIKDHLTCLLRILYAGQEATVRSFHETMDWFRIEKRVQQGCILSPCLLNLYVGYIKWNDRLDDSQARINIPRKKVNNLRNADDTTVMAEEDLKSLLMRVKEESEKAGLKLSIQKTKNMATSPLTSLQNDEEKMETVTHFIFLSSQITADYDYTREIKRCLLLRRKAMTNLVALKSRDATLLTKVHIGKWMVFPVDMYRSEIWNIKKAECQRTDASELWCSRRLLRVSWTSRRSN